jgi:hypothetical protein
MYNNNLHLFVINEYQFLMKARFDTRFGPNRIMKQKHNFCTEHIIFMQFFCKIFLMLIPSGIVFHEPQ